MKNFKEIAEKCLNGELSGTFIMHCQTFAKKNDVEVLKVPSKNLIIDKLHPSFPYLFKSEGVINTSCEFIANFNGSGINRFHSYKIINFIPDMKENDKRTIQISLQQAREWYNSGNDTLRTLALSSFSKKELDPYPRSFNEYFEKHSNGSNILKMYPTKELEEKFNAYIKLISLRYDWIHIWSQEQGLEKDWTISFFNPGQTFHHYIGSFGRNSNIDINLCSGINHPLSFPTRELAQDFLNTFKSLLEQAKGLY